MDKKRLIEIGKDLIFIAGAYSKITNEKEKTKLLNTFTDYEKELRKDTSKYTNTVLGFVVDLKNDLLNGRELNIESTYSDDYLNNYFVTMRELKYFNNLINKDIYKQIFIELNAEKNNIKKISKLIVEFEEKFNENLLVLSSKNIGKNLLIFTLFHRNKPLPALRRILYFLLKTNKLNNESLIIKNLIKTYKLFIKKVKSGGLASLEKNNFNYKYLKSSNNPIDGKVVINAKISDASIDNFRSGKPEFEYKNLIFKL